MQITWHGHGMMELVAQNGTNILIDPWTVGGAEYPPNPRNDLTPEDMSPDIIPITHGDAFDHAGEASLYDAPIITQSHMARTLRQKTHREDIDAFDIGGEYEFEGVSFTMTHAHHSIGTFHTEYERVDFGGVSGGYLIDDGETAYYHSGDTGLFGDMKMVIGDVYQPDIAAIPIGGLYTMQPEHAAVAVEWLGVDAVIPYHYGTFPGHVQDAGEFITHVEDRSDADVLDLDPSESTDFSP